MCICTDDSNAGRVATALTSGYSHTCAFLSDQTVLCWGYNAEGQLGIGSTMNVGDAPNEMGSYLQIVDLGTGKSILYMGTQSNFS